MMDVAKPLQYWWTTICCRKHLDCFSCCFNKQNKSISAKYLDLALYQLEKERSSAYYMANMRRCEALLHLLHDETIVQAMSFVHDASLGQEE